MKKFMKIFGLVTFGCITSCSVLPQPIPPTTSESVKTATILKDCTGTYARFEGNNSDYLVCNPTILSSYPSGSRARITFRSTGKCSLAKDVACRMIHESKGNINILKVE